MDNPNVDRLHEELITELTNVIHSVNSNKIISWHDEHPINDEQERADIVIAAHDPNKPTKNEATQAEGRAHLVVRNGTNMDNIPMPVLSSIVRALIQIDHPDWIDAEGILNIPEEV